VTSQPSLKEEEEFEWIPEEEAQTEPLRQSVGPAYSVQGGSTSLQRSSRSLEATGKGTSIRSESQPMQAVAAGFENRQTKATGKGTSIRSESQPMQEATSEWKDEKEVRQPASSSQLPCQELALFRGLNFSQELIRDLVAEGIGSHHDLEHLSQGDLDRFLAQSSLSLGDKGSLRAAVEQRGAKRQRSSSDQHPLSEASRAPPPSAPPLHLHVTVQPEMQQKPQPVPQPPPYPPASRLIEGEDTELCAIEEIEVDQLFYSQRSIIDHFKCGRPVVRLLQALQRGEVRLDHPNLTLQVVEWKTWDQGEKTMRLHSSDNRRLWCLKRYKNWLGQPVYVKCRVVTYEAYRHLRTNCEHFDTMNGGTSIEVRKRKW